MFDIERVDLFNFMSFEGEHTFKFPTRVGLYSITGKNLFNPRLGANDCGKSTLLAAVYWCLYGKTPRGLKADNIVTWDQKHAWVGVEIVVDEVHWYIKRSQSPNNLTALDRDDSVLPIGVTHKPLTIDQETLQKYLRLGPEAFCYAVLLPQFGKRFFALSAGDKLTLLSSILGLDYWLERSAAAKTKAETIDKEVEINVGFTTKHEGQIESAKDDLKKLIKEEADFDAEQNRVIRALEREMIWAKKEYKEIELKEVDAKKLLVSLEEGISNFTKRHTVLSQKLDSMNTRIVNLLADKKSVISRIERFDGLTDYCPTCLQKVDKNHINYETDHLLEKKVILSTHIEKSNNDRENVIDKITAINGSLHEIDKERIGTNSYLIGLKHKKGENKRRLAEIQSLIAKETDRPNLASKMIKEKQAFIKQAQAKLDETHARIDLLVKHHTAVEYWVLGFKRVRLHIIEATLQQLEVEVNNSLASLGLLEWRVTFDVERENKSGGITKGFTVLVHAPNRSQPVPVEAWSGGATQRLMLAGDLGLASLIMEQAGLRGTLEFFDEPSMHLSTEGILDLAETLCQRAEDTGKRIFLIDHNNIDFGGFLGVVTVVKDENKHSHIEK